MEKIILKVFWIIIVQSYTYSLKISKLHRPAILHAVAVYAVFSFYRMDLGRVSVLTDQTLSAAWCLFGWNVDDLTKLFLINIS